MSFSTPYPKPHQWLSHGGEMLVQPSANGLGVDVRLGDAGGFPQGRPSHGSTLEEALAVAETNADGWLEVNKKLQDDLLSGDFADVRNEEFIRVAARRLRLTSTLAVASSEGFGSSCLWRAQCYDSEMDQAILEREALRLPAHERALLADALLGSLDDEAVRRVEAAWGKEAEARLAAYHRGEITALDGPEVLRELRRRYAK